MVISENGIVDANYWNGVIFHLFVQVYNIFPTPDLIIMENINITNNEALGGLVFIERKVLDIDIDIAINIQVIPSAKYFHVDISQLRVIDCTNCGSLAITIGDYVHLHIHDNYIYNNTFGSSTGNSED